MSCPTWLTNLPANTPFRPSITLRVSNLAVAFVADVELLPKPTLPFVEAAVVSLAAPPLVDLKVRRRNYLTNRP